MAATEQQQIALTLVHARQLERLLPVVERMSEPELAELEHLVAACSNHIWHVRRQRTAQRTKPARAPKYGRGLPKLSDAQVRAIRQAYAAAPAKRGLQAQLGRQYGVEPSTIAAIVKGKVRRDVA